MIPSGAGVPMGGRLEGQTQTRGMFTWLRDVRSELRKCAWPTRQEATKLTSVVIAISVAVGMFLGGADALFGTLIRWFLK
jgi:preprotein translocase subunit SecE